MFRFLSKKVAYFLMFFSSMLFGSLADKSAMVYYGYDISYPMVGIHDYIIVQPEHIDTHTHGFDLYKNKLYAYVSINEIEPSIKEFKKVKKSWIVSENKDWGSVVLDITNNEYKEFIFKYLIQPRIDEGFQNFFFDTLDSYQFHAKTPKQKLKAKNALIAFINEFHQRYPQSKLIINRGFEMIDEIHDSIDAVLFESYYAGLGGETGYKDVSDADREWLDIQINRIKYYNLDVISVEYLNPVDIEANAEAIVKNIKARGMIPFISNRELNIYGISSKNAKKREIFTLINEENLDRTLQEAHQNGATVLEYMGYIEKLHNIEKGLPSIDLMRHYAGVIVWLQTGVTDEKKFFGWLKELIDNNIKVVFANELALKKKYLKELGITITDQFKKRKSIFYQDDIVGFEIEPALTSSHIQIKAKSEKNFLVYRNNDGSNSVVAAKMPWGGFAYEGAFMSEVEKENLWVIDPFEFFQQTLELEPLVVPDPTTENGTRLFFSHIDGDGIMNRVEGDQKHFSGEVILNDILKKYPVPHSVSIIGAEIDKNGLYPKLSHQLTQIAKDMFKLENVEAVTHTFTHPFYWSQIRNNSLPKEYRLQVKDYNFSIEREISQSIEEINNNLIPKNKKQKTKMVFWTGDCSPMVNALSHTYKNNILNMNGGDTTIMNSAPWLTRIAPFGLERDGYYQIYTGAQNENVYTNDWLGPFWGFKKVIQTFQLTNSPRRFKPIDIYYHIYSGSKMASIKALRYVFDWVMQQDTMPIFTSEYIPKVMDFYDVSMANEKNRWLVSGLRDLKTLRMERKDFGADMKHSKTLLGVKHFQNHTYYSFDQHQQHYFKVTPTQSMRRPYLISANGATMFYQNTKKVKQYRFVGHVDMKINYNLPRGCRLQSTPRAICVEQEDANVTLKYINAKDVSLKVICK